MRAVPTQKRSLRDNGGIDRHWEAINRNATQIASHEAMCEERSKTIFNRLDRIDSSREYEQAHVQPRGDAFGWYGRAYCHLAHEVR